MPIKTNPIQTQFQSRSEAEIPVGELLRILKPGTNFPDLKILILPDMLDILLKNYKLGLSAHSMSSCKKLC